MENTKKQQIIDLFLLGYSKGIISEMVDTSEGYVGKIVSIYLKEKGIKLQSESMITKQKIKFYLNSGITASRVAEFVGVSRQYVSRVKHELI